MTYAERLYDAFGDGKIGWDAAKALGEIVGSDTVLTKANHADIKVILKFKMYYCFTDFKRP